MKSSPFSLFTDSSNDRNLEKMSPLTAKLFDEDEHKYVTQFLDMCLGNIFQSVNGVLEKHEIPRVNCIALGVDNASVNVVNTNH